MSIRWGWKVLRAAVVIGMCILGLDLFGEEVAKLAGVIVGVPAWEESFGGRRFWRDCRRAVVDCAVDGGAELGGSGG